MEGIVNKAKSEVRALSNEEDSRFEEIKNEIEAIDKTIEKEEETSIEKLNNSIKLKVESSDVINSIKEINLNSPNYIKNGCFLNDYDNWDETLKEDSAKSIVDSTSRYKKAFKIVTNGDDQKHSAGNRNSAF